MCSPLPLPSAQTPVGLSITMILTKNGQLLVPQAGDTAKSLREQTRSWCLVQIQRPPLTCSRPSVGRGLHFSVLPSFLTCKREIKLGATSGGSC